MLEKKPKKSRTGHPRRRTGQGLRATTPEEAAWRDDRENEGRIVRGARVASGAVLRVAAARPAYV
jgi:hypothetical protein